MAPQPLSLSPPARAACRTGCGPVRPDHGPRHLRPDLGWLGLASLVLIVVFSGLTFLWIAPQDNDANGPFYITWETMPPATTPAPSGATDTAASRSWP